MKNKKYILFGLLFSLFFNFAFADYELENFKLKDQLLTQERGLHHKDLSLASDIEIWKYWGDVSGFYHGAGHRIDVFAEYSLTQRITLNADLIFVNGSISSGYLGNTREELLFGATWKFSENSSLRLLDLGKITIASGGFVEKAYASGGYYFYKSDKWTFRSYILGTSSIDVSGDLYTISVERDFSFGSLGLITYLFSRGLDFSSGDKYEPLHSLFFNSQSTQSLILNVEAGYNIDAKKHYHVVKLGFKSESKKFKLYLQKRYYEELITTYMDSNVYDYIPLNLMDRNYTNPQNIFGTNSSVDARGAHLDLAYQLSKRLSYEGMHEFVQIKHGQDQEEKFFYNEKFKYSLKKQRNNSYIFGYLTNKTLVSPFFKYDTDIYNESFIVGLGLKIFI